MEELQHPLSNEFWHLINPYSAFMLFKNMKVGKGDIITMGFAPIGASTLHGSRVAVDTKEQAFEQVRQSDSRFTSKPSRATGFYLFQDKEAALRANREWFEGQRLHIQAVIKQPHIFHQGDAQHISETEPTRWKEKAIEYWSGIYTNDPIPETIVEGIIHFPDWETLTKDAKLW